MATLAPGGRLSTASRLLQPVFRNSLMMAVGRAGPLRSRPTGVRRGVCRRSRSLSDGGRTLFGASRNAQDLLKAKARNIMSAVFNHAGHLLNHSIVHRLASRRSVGVVEMVPFCRVYNQFRFYAK